MTTSGRAHLQALAAALPLLDTDRLEAWGRELADRLTAGGRLLVAGNGGSAAEAQHLTSELVGRFDAERTPLSALALHADSCAVTAIVNDYGAEEIYARQVRAHGRPGDVLLLSASGSSPKGIPPMAGKHPRQRRQQHPVPGFQTRSIDLAAQDRDLMTQHQQLHVFGRVTAEPQHHQTHRTPGQRIHQ
jgi:phosphoheptose isomerase